MTMQTCANGPCTHCTVFKQPTFLFHSTILNSFFNCTTTSTSITNIDVASAVVLHVTRSTQNMVSAIYTDRV